MDEKVTNQTEENVKTSVASLYAQLLKRREEQKAEKEAKKKEEKEREKDEEDAKYTKEDGSKMSKKEKRQKELENWQEVIMGITGEDLEYTFESKKSKKKKYRKWISDDTNSDNLEKKPKKQKKRNYKKEFDPELNMLKSLVAEQNRFTNDLQRRFNYAVGPAAKDAAPMNKTMVELASAINVSRSNSLTTLRTIGDLKKTIAQLYHKQAEIDMKKAGSSGSDDNGDLSLMGSSIIKSLDGLSNPYLAPMPSQQPTQPTYSMPEVPQAPVQPSAPAPVTTPAPVATTPTVQPQPQQQQLPNIELSISDFDASSWEGPELPDKQVLTENTPHEIVVMRDKQNGSRRFAAMEPGTDREIPNFPVPTYDPNDRPINEEDHRLKGYFDDSYRVIDVG